MRVIVTGDRHHTDVALIEGALEFVYLGFINAGRAITEEFVVVHGGARGADFIASVWAAKHKRLSVVNEPHPANWDEFSKAAGSIRNQEMVDLGAELCLAFPLAGSIGTWNCVNKAKKAGIEVRIFESKRGTL
jgi:hypothetical protein